MTTTTFDQVRDGAWFRWAGYSVFFQKRSFSAYRTEDGNTRFIRSWENEGQRKVVTSNVVTDAPPSVKSDEQVTADAGNEHAWFHGVE